MNEKSLFALDFLSGYVALTGVVFKTPTFRMMAGQYPYEVKIKRLPWGRLSQSPVEIVRECTENTILEFRDDEDNVRGVIFLPEADKENPFKRIFVYKHFSERLQEVWEGHKISLRSFV
ncbi:MAG TPA: hypothetical protein ACFYD2_08520 [Candidatus Avalokitesvara rifleensis]|uniref:hypothetical protein n=1 Tax=Candidatus Avalokitesvara rifleensis TaxID=3367620 RepID=UPI002713506B|nr:hypothetical protein [Candidatus Brocadiales bacterium]